MKYKKDKAVSVNLSFQFFWFKKALNIKQIKTKTKTLMVALTVSRKETVRVHGVMAFMWGEPRDFDIHFKIGIGELMETQIKEGT